MVKSSGVISLNLATGTLKATLILAGNNLKLPWEGWLIIDTGTIIIFWENSDTSWEMVTFLGEIVTAAFGQLCNEISWAKDAETSKRYRHMLSQGGSKPGMDLYLEFRGQEPEIEPLLKKKGFM